MSGSDFADWRRIREDFESLPPADWSLFWSSRAPVSWSGVQLQSQWTWFYPIDASLRVRANAIFLKAAKARGYDSEDNWLDELRYADFVQFQIDSDTHDKLRDGTCVDSESGTLKNAINHSITLCHQLEAGSAPKPLIGRLPKDAMARIEAATAAFMADFVPKLEREANTGGPVRNTELLLEFVLHQFNIVARESMALCASLAEFEGELHGDIARFVQFNVSQCRWLGPMRHELDSGFICFFMRANPWLGIPEAARASKWHVGAITGEALAHAAQGLMIEATARAAAGGFAKPDRAGVTETSADGPSITEGTKRRKRGRPTEIADELKQKAISVTGGTARAKILYQVNYPSSQQVKNVPAILKHYQKQIKAQS